MKSKMSLCPFYDFNVLCPSRLLHQIFGLGLDPEDFITAPIIPRDVRSLLNNPVGYFRPWVSVAPQQDAGSTLTADNNKFRVNLDVQHFAPEEIAVKTTGEDTIEVEGKHKEKKDEHGYISRHFVRKYKLPKGHDIGKVRSSLSSDGVLSITAPRVDVGALEYREVPIQQTGKTVKGVQEKGDQKNK